MTPQKRAHVRMTQAEAMRVWKELASHPLAGGTASNANWNVPLLLSHAQPLSQQRHAHNPQAIDNPVGKRGWEASEDEAQEEVQHKCRGCEIQALLSPFHQEQQKQGPASNHHSTAALGTSNRCWPLSCLHSGHSYHSRHWLSMAYRNSSELNAIIAPRLFRGTTLSCKCEARHGVLARKSVSEGEAAYPVE